MRMWGVVLIVSLVTFLETGYSQTVKLGTLAPEGSPWYETLQDIGAQWKNGTGGAIKFKIYPGGIVGDEADMIRKMRIGQLHAAALTAVGLAKIIPEINVFQLPMLIENNEELDYAIMQMGPKLEKLLEEKGFIVLSWGDAGWIRLFSQKPVVYPKDLKGQRIFVWAGDTESFQAWKAAGYHPVEVAGTDVLTSLQTGLINANLTTPIAALSFQWFALSKHMMDMVWGPLVGATVITKKKWNQLPADVRPKLKETARSTGDILKERIRQLDEESIEIMKGHGHKGHAVPVEARREWIALTNKYVYDEFFDTLVPKQMYEELKRHLEQFRASK